MAILNTNSSDHVRELIQALRCLPGIGQKSAQRIAFHLLQRDREGAKALAETLAAAVANVGLCQRCRTLTEHALCVLCQDSQRDACLLCVVESPADVWSLEQTGVYRGHYFVLHGRLSPLDGIGPEELGLPLLTQRLSAPDVKELIIATSATVEGEATAYQLAEHARQNSVQVSRIAHGLPMGGALEYTDSHTLAHALSGRTSMP
ncbi:MAG: recombination mediator RecR [Methylococcales bacterium]|nr:recombination mediator RecR [Methylococcales bacterium]